MGLESWEDCTPGNQEHRDCGWGSCLAERGTDLDLDLGLRSKEELERGESGMELLPKGQDIRKAYHLLEELHGEDRGRRRGLREEKRPCEVVSLELLGEAG